MADLQTGTDKAELKALLRRASEEHPVRCAVGQPKEGPFAMLLVDKTRQPRALSTDLEKNFAGTKNPRWGTAFPDVNRLPPESGGTATGAIDEKLVVFLVNKPAPGLAKRLVKTLKLNMTGFSKVEVRFEDGSPPEKDAEEEDGADAAAEPVATAAAPVQQPETPAGPDLAALHKELAELAPKIVAAAGADAAKRAAFVKLAGDANAALKAGDGVTAGKAIGDLRTGIEGGGAATQAARQVPAGTVAYAKSRLAWLAARSKMEGDIEKLRVELVEYYKDTSIVGELTAAYHDRVAPVLAALDEELADLLDDARNAEDPAARAKLVEQAKAAIGRYQAFLAGDKTIAGLDSNPIVPLTIQQTMTSTLGVLAAMVH